MIFFHLFLIFKSFETRFLLKKIYVDGGEAGIRSPLRTGMSGQLLTPIGFGAGVVLKGRNGC
jgi:hypothetical protein